MSLGISVGDSSFRADVPVDSFAKTIAKAYQLSMGEVEDQSTREDFNRVLYNVKQIAFNVSTVAAALFGAFAAVGLFSLTTGVVFTALFWTARTLVLQDIRVMLVPFARNSWLEGDFSLLKNKEAIEDFVNNSRSPQIFLDLQKGWKVGFEVKGEFVWRSLIPLRAKPESLINMSLK